MASLNEFPQHTVEDIVRIACSDPDFITAIYIVIKLAERVEARNRSSAPTDRITTVIGGAAFMLHAYVLNGRNKQRMQHAIHAVPQTHDIDIAMWYKNIIETDEFIRRNKRMENAIRDTFAQYRNHLQEILISILPNPSVIRTFEIEVPESSTYQNMTTTIKVNFIINGQRITIADVAMKNAIYSQRINNKRDRSAIPVEQNITYVNNDNTIRLKIRDSPSEYVRVPTLERLIEQQQFAMEAMRGRANTSKYQARIDYLMQYQQLGSPAALDEVRARLARAEQSTREMIATLPVPASLSRPLSQNSGRPPLHRGPSRRGGKRHTYNKNKRHTRRKHSRRH